MLANNVHDGATQVGALDALKLACTVYDAGIVRLGHRHRHAEQREHRLHGWEKVAISSGERIHEQHNVAFNWFFMILDR